MEYFKKPRSARNPFSVHVSNIPTHCTEMDILDLFGTMTVDDAPEVYLNPMSRDDSRFTFAFVRYRTQEEAEKACRTFDGVRMGKSRIGVTISLDTKQRIEENGGNVHMKAPLRRTNSLDRSILRGEMPGLDRSRFTVLKRDENAIHKKLKSNLSSLTKLGDEAKMVGVESKDDIKDFMADLRDILVDISGIPYGVAVNPIRYGAEPVSKSDVEDLLVRYYDTPERDIPFKDVDIDLTGGKELGEDQFDKFFPFYKDDDKGSKETKGI